MRRRQHPILPYLEMWMDFWFFTPAPKANLVLFRFGTAILLLYVLFVRSFDLQAQIATSEMISRITMRELDPIYLPISIFSWVEGPVWMWVMHGSAILLAILLLMGVLSPLTAGLSLIFQLSYAHQNPLMLVGLDTLIIMALSYLTLANSSKVFGLLTPALPKRRPRLSSVEGAGQGEPDPKRELPWISLPVRVLQLHICLLYFQSALGKLTTDWLSGTALWHPRMMEMGVPFTLVTLQGEPHLTSLITYGLLLFEMFFGVLVWNRRLRYPVLICAVVVHLMVGLSWGLLPFNLMMIVLNLVFIPSRHMEFLLDAIRPLLTMPWLNPGYRL